VWAFPAVPAPPPGKSSPGEPRPRRWTSRGAGCRRGITCPLGTTSDGTSKRSLSTYGPSRARPCADLVGSGQIRNRRQWWFSGSDSVPPPHFRSDRTNLFLWGGIDSSSKVVFFFAQNENHECHGVSSCPPPPPPCTSRHRPVPDEGVAGVAAWGHTQAPEATTGYPHTSQDFPHGF